MTPETLKYEKMKRTFISEKIKRETKNMIEPNDFD